MRLVYYSISLPRDAPDDEILWMIEASIQSLRRHNQDIPVCVFAYGDAAGRVASRLGPYDVEVHDLPPYQDVLKEVCPNAWEPFSRYLFTHKWLPLREISGRELSQVLYLDTDTFFFGDVGKLFENYSGASCYAREEPFSRRSLLGYRPKYLDEDRLLRIGRSDGVTPVPPFNAGVVMLNNGVWRHLGFLEDYLSYLWRFMTWNAIHAQPDRLLAHQKFLRDNLDRLVSKSDRISALEYPSGNLWLEEEVALWMALGKTPDMSYQDFSRHDVSFGHEFLKTSTRRCRAIMVHYLSNNVRGFYRSILEHSVELPDADPFRLGPLSTRERVRLRFRFVRRDIESLLRRVRARLSRVPLG